MADSESKVIEQQPGVAQQQNQNESGKSPAAQQQNAASKQVIGELIYFCNFSIYRRWR